MSTKRPDTTLYRPSPTAYIGHRRRHISAIGDGIYRPSPTAYIGIADGMYWPSPTAYIGHRRRHISAIADGIYRPSPTAYIGHRRRHVFCAGRDVPVLNMTASAESFRTVRRTCPAHVDTHVEMHVTLQSVRTKPWDVSTVCPDEIAKPSTSNSLATCTPTSQECMGLCATATSERRAAGLDMRARVDMHTDMRWACATHRWKALSPRQPF